MAVAFTACSFGLSAQQVKGDPWIFQVYKELYGRQPNAWEIQIKLYNNGSWKDYNQLKQYVKDYQASLSSNSLSVSVTAIKSSPNAAALINQNGKTIAADLISQDGNGIVAQGGGNLVNTNGSNLKDVNGNNIVAQGGGNLRDIPGASLGSNRQLMAGDKKIIKTSGQGAIIIR